jgi:hypothetical protein
MKMEPTSEAFDRREVEVLTGETAERGEQRLLPIIRTDAGGFFGFSSRVLAAHKRPPSALRRVVTSAVRN